MFTALFTIIAAATMIAVASAAGLIACTAGLRRYRLWAFGRCSTKRCGHPREWMSFCSTCRSRMPATERQAVEEAARAAAALERAAHEFLAATYTTDIERLTRTTADV